MANRPIIPPATPPAIAPTFGLLLSLPGRTGAVEEVGLAEGDNTTVFVTTAPLSVTSCNDVCGSGVLLGVGEVLLLYYAVSTSSYSKGAVMM